LPSERRHLVCRVRAHQLAPRKAIVIGRGEHHLEAMIFRGERVAGFVLDFDVEASGE
jgi:hypothetical protein